MNINLHVLDDGIFNFLNKIMHTASKTFNDIPTNLQEKIKNFDNFAEI